MVYFDGKKVDEDDDETTDLSGENYDYPRLRGVIGFDAGWSEVLTDAGVDEVASAVAAMRGGVVASYEVDDSLLVQSAYYCPVFRLKGVNWTYLQVIAARQENPARRDLGEPELASLSRGLGARVIEFGYSDTAAAVTYTYHDRGELREAFEGVCGSVERFESKDREVDFGEDDIDEDAFAEEFLVSQDALAAGEGFRSHGQDGPKPADLPERFETARFVIVPHEGRRS